MKSQRLIAIILCLVLSGFTLARAQDMDSAISKLTEDVAAKIKDNGNKKVTVLDFTDLDGKPTALGKYVAEQLTVDFVMSKRDFSVLDRANLKRIMAENKMSVSGLVNPENAKKLGMFSGVDAMIFGTITPVGTNINVTVKIITTETAEIVGGAKTQFKSDDTVQQFLSQPAKAEDAPDAPKTPPPPAALATQQFSNLVVSVNKLIKQDNGGLILNFTMQNKSDKNSIAVAMFHDTCFVKPCSLLSTILAGDGTQFVCDDGSLTGIGSTRFSPDGLTEIQPGGTAKVSITYQQAGWGTGARVPNNVISFTWQANVILNQNYHVSDYDNYKPNPDTLPPHCKTQNVSLDIQLPRDQ